MRLGVALGAAAMAAALLAACDPGGGATASSTAGLSSTPSAGERASPASRSPAPASAAAASAATASDQAGGPPAAYLQGAGLGGLGAAGAEGSFSWNGTGSDAPWIVHPAAGARGAGPWLVTFDPPLPAERWSARWAPVSDGVAGDPQAGSRGGGPDIVVPAPARPGTWSLQLEASFGAGRNAAWYWTVDVLP